MAVGILTEKPSAARNFAKALGGMSGTFEGVDYTIVAARGHLFGFAPPTNIPWSMENLPWDETKVKFTYMMAHGASSDVANIQRVLGGADEIVIASDIDPTGEGDLLAWEIIDELNLHHKSITRMEFVDETPKSLQAAFRARRTVRSMMDEGNYRKAIYRSKFDYLSMQWSRAATLIARSHGRNTVLRNGRLKSAMVVLVGEQLRKYNEYVPKSSFSNRFVDDKGVMYVNPEEPSFDTRGEVPATYTASTVVPDEVKPGKTAPPKLLDLSTLSALLAKKGFDSAAVVSTYQKMYEDMVVSYPRTEDKFVSPEQFNELLPHVDAIATMVGVDPTMLTHRSPRRTHVKNGGAHGANRPGPNVPASLDAVEKKYKKLGRVIYETLARNYLTMLAGDYLYDTHIGHIKDYPDFVGRVQVERDPGWRGIFDADADERDDDDAGTGLGTTAQPRVHESVTPRPPHPTMSWLMKQLERGNVGTGATRTSTFVDVTATGAKKVPLLKSDKGKITLTDPGEVNFYLLHGTKIGDVSLTTDVQHAMRDIAEGVTDEATQLALVKDWVVADIAVMKKNAASMPKNVGGSTVDNERMHGTWQGRAVKVKRTFLQHTFTPEEEAELMASRWVEAKFVSSKGSSFVAKVRLADKSFINDEGKTINYVGFDMEFVDDNNGSDGDKVEMVLDGKTVRFKPEFNGERFTDAEIEKLVAGKEIVISRVSKKSGKPYKAKGKIAERSFTNKEGKEITFYGFDIIEFVK